MAAHRFTQSEIHFLKMLPAVKDVSSSRISYSDEFRDSATRRYLAGESPVKIFREAGLDPRLIGYKRIERAFARWRDATHGIPPQGADGSSNLAASAALNVPMPKVESAVASLADEDPRDRLIAKQALRIAELEMQRDQLIEQLKSVY